MSRIACFQQQQFDKCYHTGVSVIVGSSVGLAKAPGVIEVMLMLSMLLGEMELLDWPATMPSEPTLPEMKGASAPRFMIPVQVKISFVFRRKKVKSHCSDEKGSYLMRFYCRGQFTWLMHVRAIVHVGR